jgi:hypothetical protein
VTASTLGAEVGRATHHRPDAQGIYFVFTSNMPSGVTFCGWHAGATVDSTRVAVVYVPNAGQRSMCDAGDRVRANSVSPASRTLANVAAHELFEAMTDADPGPTTSAWIDDAGAEIGDKCAWQFDAPVILTNGTRWQLQKEWSNATRRCEQA